MQFSDRQQAGEQLANALLKYRERRDTIVIGLPRGGVVIAFQVAKKLHLPLDVICPRKIGAPQNPELAIGAVTEAGEPILDARLIQELGVTEEHLAQAISEVRERSRKRLELYREGRPPLELRGKTVILVDDGLATGATMRAAIASARSRHAHRIIVAVPVAPQDTVDALSALCDTMVCLSTPFPFYSVGQFYDAFGQTDDAEVIQLLRQSE